MLKPRLPGLRLATRLLVQSLQRQDLKGMLVWAYTLVVHQFKQINKYKL